MSKIKKERRVRRYTVVREFSRVNCGMWVEQHGYYSGFRSPRDGKDRVPLSRDEIDLVHALVDGARLLQSRHYVKDVGYASAFYLASDGVEYPEVYDRTVFSLIARGVVLPRYDEADNVYFALSPYGQKMAEACVKRRLCRKRGGM